MTIPIYFGATKINNFFNTDGIIQPPLLNIESVDKIIKNCNERDYSERLSAIIDNYDRVQKYLCIEDFIWENYHSHFA